MPNQQIIELSGHSRIVIETVHGIITLEWTGKAKKWRARLPEGLTAQRTAERAMESAKFLQQDSDGRILPKYQIIEPVTGEHGELLGVRMPPVFRLASTA